MITDNFGDFATSVIAQIRFDVHDLLLDHFGYQTSSKDDYEKLKEESLKLGDLVSENIVNGRRVGIFKFHKPYEYNGFKIPGFELIEPKEGQVCKSELDHVEFVIPVSFGDFINLHQEVEWDLSAKDRPEFAKISIVLKNGKSIKFHRNNIFDEIPK